MELLNALLDFVDALATAVGWVVFWYTWVAPPGHQRASPPPATDPDRLEHFLTTVAAAGRRSNRTSAAGDAA